MEPETIAENLPEDWKCPLCRKGREQFKQV
ncbi:MAG: rubredoxin [Bacillota bacterium]|nr:rubredoxin [Bacillota bacterium]